MAKEVKKQQQLQNSTTESKSSTLVQQISVTIEEKTLPKEENNADNGEIQIKCMQKHKSIIVDFYNYFSLNSS